MQSQNSTPVINAQPKKKKTSFRKFDYQTGYTLLPNELIRDNSISFGALGLLTYLLQLPEKVQNDKGDWEPWVIYHSYIRKQRKMGETALNTLIAELIEAGYMKRERKRFHDGRFSPYEYVYAPFKLFLPNVISQPGLSGPVNPELTNTNPCTTNKETAAVAIDSIEKLLPDTKTARPIAAASSVEEGERTQPSKRVVAQASPLTITKQKSSSILDTLDISSHEKQWLLNHYNLPDIELSIAWVTNPTTQVKKSVICALKWFLALPTEDRPKTPGQNTEEASINKQLAEHLEKTLTSDHYQILVLNKHLLVEPKIGSGEVVEIPYDKENFEKTVKDAIGKRGFRIIKP